MVTTARKTDAQRLGNGKKAFNVKQVEKMVKEGSIEYTAGAGISISSENAISVDTATIQPKMSAGSGISISAENAISVDTTTIQEKLTAGTGITIADNIISATSDSEYILLESISDLSLIYDSSESKCLKDFIIEIDSGINKSGTNMQSCRLYTRVYFNKGETVYNDYINLTGATVDNVISNCDVAITTKFRKWDILLHPNNVIINYVGFRLDLTANTVTIFGYASKTITYNNGYKIYYKA